VHAEDVAAAQIVAKSGNIFLQRISRAVDAMTPTSGNIFLKDSSGMIGLELRAAISPYPMFVP
jgi:hypothetical protein